METGSQQNEDGVYIIHRGTGNRYFFKFNPEIEEKTFIFNIKQFLIPKHYPRLVESITEPVELSPEELAKKIEEGIDPKYLKKIELREIGQRLYRIDKSIIWKSIFILVLEDIQLYGEQKQVVPTNVLRYRLNSNAASFLKKYRSGGFKSIEEASKEFFSNSILINEIEN
jgi:hypothetical protein